MDGGARSATGPELERAARLVLGRAPGANVRREELRRAFRTRALEVHPDRAAAVGRDPEELARAFRELCAAHALLDSELFGRRAPERRPSRAPARAPRGLPPRPLRFAEFLYYAGRISWSDLAGAVAWRRKAGRRIGQWFVERGLLEAAEVREVRAQLSRHNATQPTPGRYAPQPSVPFHSW